VSIKMAKTQNLSLNPTKISGTCGRLMCCLKYEQDTYEDLLRTSPKAESFVDTPEGRGTIVEVDLLRQRVKVRLEDQPEVIATFPNEEIAVLRSGKAKKNDPPIPADLAPISGSGKRVQKEEAPEPETLDPIRFRYSEEVIVEEEPEMETEIPEEEAAEEEARKPRRRNRRSRSQRKPQKAAEEAAPEEPAEAPQEPEESDPQDAPAQKAKKPFRRRPNYRRRNRQNRESKSDEG